LNQEIDEKLEKSDWTSANLIIYNVCPQSGTKTMFSSSLQKCFVFVGHFQPSLMFVVETTSLFNFGALLLFQYSELSLTYKCCLGLDLCRSMAKVKLG